MLNPNERWVNFYELFVASEPQDAPPIDLNRLTAPLIRRIENDESYQWRNNETAVIRMTDVKHYPSRDILLLLFQYADKSVTAPTFMDLETGQLRTEPLLEGEGVAVSAHAAISTRPMQHNNPRHLMLLEQVIGLGKSAVQPFLRAELKEASDGVLTDWNDDITRETNRNYKPSATIRAINGITLGEELDSGSIITRIELINETSAGRIDEHPEFEEQLRQVIVRPRRRSGVLDSLRGLLFEYNAEGYTKYKIRYRTAKGKNKTGEMNATEEDVADTLLSRTEKVITEAPLSQCSEKIVPEVARSMISILESNSGAFANVGSS